MAPLSPSLRRAALISTLVVALITIAAPADAQTAAPTHVPTVAATASAPPATAAALDNCPGTYSAAAESALTDQPGSAATETPDALEAAALRLIPVRYQYQDGAVPAGCETTRTRLIRLLGLDEDLLVATAAIQADPANSGTYTDFLSKAWQGHKESLNGVATAAATALATALPVTKAAASDGKTCTNSAIPAQISADVGGFPNLYNATEAQVATAALTVIKIRYTYENELATAPAGCAVMVNDGLQFMALSEDTLLLNLIAQIDQANAKAVEAFRVATVVPRIQSLNGHFAIDLGFATPGPSPTSGTP